MGEEGGTLFFSVGPDVAPFDAVKYQRLMDGLEAVEMKLSEVMNENDEFRFDSDFFSKKFLANNEILKGLPNLGFSQSSGAG